MWNVRRSKERVHNTLHNSELRTQTQVLLVRALANTKLAGPARIHEKQESFLTAGVLQHFGTKIDSSFLVHSKGNVDFPPSYSEMLYLEMIL